MPRVLFLIGSALFFPWNSKHTRISGNWLFTIGSIGFLFLNGCDRIEVGSTLVALQEVRKAEALMERAAAARAATERAAVAMNVVAVMERAAVMWRGRRWW